MLCWKERLLAVPSGTAAKAGQQSQTPFWDCPTPTDQSAWYWRSPQEAQGPGDTHTLGSEWAAVAVCTLEDNVG